MKDKGKVAKAARKEAVNRLPADVILAAAATKAVG